DCRQRICREFSGAACCTPSTTPAGGVDGWEKVSGSTVPHLLKSRSDRLLGGEFSNCTGLFRRWRGLPDLRRTAKTRMVTAGCGGRRSETVEPCPIGSPHAVGTACPIRHAERFGPATTKQ